MKKDFQKEINRALTVEIPSEFLGDENQNIPRGAAPNTRAFLINLKRIKEDEDQPRKHFDNQYLDKLANSIKEIGVLSPINVSYNQSEDYYIIAAGANRFRAAQLAGLKEIPCILINNLEPKDRLILQLTENLLREDLNPIEEAEGYSRLMKISNLNQQEIAQKVGKDKSEISRSLKLLNELTSEEQHRIKVAPAQLLSKSLLLEALRAPNLELRGKILKGELNRIEARMSIKDEKKIVGRPKNYIYKFKGDNFTLRIKFSKIKVTTSELKSVLQSIIDALTIGGQ
jgi:ParB family chromosome partitioning protein